MVIWHHHPPGPPRHVHLRVHIHFLRYRHMLDATASWTKSATGTPTGYIAQWSYNGALQPAYTVPASAAQDLAGYSQDFVTSNPTVTVKGGDVIGFTVQAVDVTNSLSSAVVASTPPTVTEPTPPPTPPGVPQSVTLALS